MKTLHYLGLLVTTNLRASLALRGAFVLQAVFMALNNLVYFVVWVVFFRRFHDLNGFGMADMELTYGIVAAGFGLVTALAGGLRELSKMIIEGALDNYLTQPKPALIQALCSRTLASGWGDFASGLVMIALSHRVSLSHVPGLLLAVVISATVLASAGVAFHSAAFWLGPVESLARLLWDFLVSLSIYPEPIFGGGVRILLFSLMPAAFCGFLPARLAQHPTAANLISALGGAVAVSCVALFLFERGLRRYESGNQIGVR